MDLDLHPDIRLRKLSIGAEGAPLLAVDNVVNDAHALVDHAAGSAFSAGPGFYPGIRVAAPPEYQQLILTRLHEALLDCLGVQLGELRFSLCRCIPAASTPASCRT